MCRCALGSSPLYFLNFKRNSRQDYSNKLLCIVSKRHLSTKAECPQKGRKNWVGQFGEKESARERQRETETETDRDRETFGKSQGEEIYQVVEEIECMK